MEFSKIDLALNTISASFRASSALAFLLVAGAVAAKENGKIVHDAEYYIIEAQNGEKWAAEDKELDKKLAELQKKRGRPPNIIQEPYWFLFDKGPVTAMHGSPWRYDTHVPLIFIGPGIQSKTVHRRVHPVDVAPTISALLGMTPPGSAQGSPLGEVFQ